ncbi:MAG: lipocalin family protein [Pseudomonadota bacterium]
MAFLRWPAIFALGAGAALASCAGQPDYRAAESEPATVAAVDLERYAGRWREVARYPNRFQKGCVSTTATYRVMEDGRIAVKNECRTDDGGVDAADGVARVIEGSGGAKLKVRFAPAWVPFAEGDYWIFHLEADYSAALVGDPDGKYLWILGRDEQLEPPVLERVLTTATRLGFETDPLRFAKDR